MAKDRDILSSLNEQELDVYCDFYGVDLDTVKKDTFTAKYILEKETWLNSLIVGYREMSGINQEICSEFAGCDLDICLE